MPVLESHVGKPDPSSGRTSQTHSNDWQVLVGACVLGFYAAGYVSFLSHPLHLFLPTVLTILLLFVPSRLVSGANPRILGVIGFLFGLVLLSALTGADPGMRAVGFALFSVTPLLLLSLRAGIDTERFLEVFAVIATIAMIVWSWLLYSFLGGIIGPWGGWTPAGSSNLYGLQLTMLWPVLLYFSFQVHPGRAFAFRILSALALIFAVLTYSRAAIICSLAIAVILGLRGRYWRALAAGIALVLLGSPQIHTWLSFSRLSDFEPTLGRLAIWKQTLAIAQDNLLFGVSPGGASEVLASLDVYHAHSNTLNMLLESGALSAILFVVIQFWLGFLALRLIRAGLRPACLGGAIAAWLASGQVATTITNPELTVTLALIVVVARQELTKWQVGRSQL